MTGEWYCPKCNEELKVTADYPDTGTSVGFMEMECSNKHKFILEIERQVGQGTLREVKSG